MVGFAAKTLAVAQLLLLITGRVSAIDCPGFESRGYGYPTGEAADECVTNRPCAEKCTGAGLICSDPDKNTWVTYDCMDKAGNYYTFDDYGLPMTDECDQADPCGVHGQCVDRDHYSINTITCECDQFWTGVKCDQKDECESGALTCHNNQPCTEISLKLDGDAFCDCGVGYSGDLCELNDECITNPDKDPHCTGNTHCNDGHLDTPSTLTCACDDNYFGVDCTDTDECITNPAYENYCGDYGHCIDDDFENLSVYHIRCDCTVMPGISGDRCEIENECSTTRKKCLNGSLCTDPDSVTLNNAYCTCREGFSGDDCQKENECASGGWTCDNNGLCSDPDFELDGDAFCTCEEGFSGKHCELEDECLRGGNTCDEWEECTDLDLTVVDGEIECGCALGFSGDKCLLEDECILTPEYTSCTGNGVCVDDMLDVLKTSFCLCDEGFEGDKCEYHNECTAGVNIPDCGKYGKCVDWDPLLEGSSMGCICEPGWGGADCSELRSCYTEHQACKDDKTCSECMYTPYDEDRPTTLDLLFSSIVPHDALYEDCAEYEEAVALTIKGPLENLSLSCDPTRPGPMQRLVECQLAQCTLDWQCDAQYRICAEDPQCGMCISGFVDPTFADTTPCTDMDSLMRQAYTSSYECNAFLGNPVILKDLVDCSIKEKISNHRCAEDAILKGVRSAAGSMEISIAATAVAAVAALVSLR